MVTRRRRAAGMTLVEIMVTLVISSIIAASTFMFFAGQQRIYDTQTKLLNIQQNLWAAMEVVSRYTRASGSGMFECVRPASYANAASTVGGRLKSTAPSPDPLANGLSTSLAVRPATGLRANDPANSNQLMWIPPLWIVNNDVDATDTNPTGAWRIRPGTDVLTVAFGNRTSGTDTDATISVNIGDTLPSTLIALDGVNSGDIFRRWEFVLLMVTPSWGFGTDPVVDRGCTLFQVTADPQGANTLQHGAVAQQTGGLVWNPSNDVPGMLAPGNYTSGSAGVRNFGTLTWVTFFIQQVGNGIPNLMMQQRHLSGGAGDPQVLAEGIEDLQIAFACDTGSAGGPSLANLNGEIDEGIDDAGRRTDEWRNNVPNDTIYDVASPGYCNLPIAVRITMVARTLAPDDLIDPATGNGPMDVEDHRYSPRPTDQFRRRVLSTTVYPRNNRTQ